MKIQNQKFIMRDQSTIEVRECLPEDAALFLPFTKIIGAETNFTRYSTTGKDPNIDETANEWRADLARKDRLHLGAFRNNQMLAYCKFRIPYPNDVGFKHVADFGIFSIADTWSQGLGRLLMNTIFEYSRSVGTHRIEARVRAGNDRALTFFNALGFQIEGTRKNAVLIDSQFKDEIYIAKIW